MADNWTLPAETSIGRAALVVGDLGRSQEFYQRALGLKETGRTEDGIELGPQGGGPAFLSLQAVPGAKPKPESTTGLYHIAILIPSRADLGRWLQHFLEIGYPLQGASDHLVSEAVYLADPDGNGIEIYRDRPRTEWPEAGGRLRMASDPMDADGVLRAGADGSPWDGMPPGTRLGHIHLQAGDLVRAGEFYLGLLGFDKMAEVPGALFVSAGGYHHHVGLNTWHSRGGGSAPEGSAGLAHYTLRLPDPDSVRELGLRLRNAGVELAGSPPEPVFADPDGIRLRLESSSG